MVTTDRAGLAPTHMHHAQLCVHCESVGDRLHTFTAVPRFTQSRTLRATVK